MRTFNQSAHGTRSRAFVALNVISMNNTLDMLIEDFLLDVSRAEDVMRKGWAIESPMSFRQHGLARSGSVGGFKYTFHGIGCRFDFGDHMVDYDYGHAGRTDGFDLWRLKIYGEQFDRFKEYAESVRLESDFNEAISEGRIRKSQEPYDKLYYRKAI